MAHILVVDRTDPQTAPVDVMKPALEWLTDYCAIDELEAITLVFVSPRNHFVDNMGLSLGQIELNRDVFHQTNFATTGANAHETVRSLRNVLVANDEVRLSDERIVDTRAFVIDTDAYRLSVDDWIEVIQGVTDDMVFVMVGSDGAQNDILYDNFVDAHGEIEMSVPVYRI